MRLNFISTYSLNNSIKSNTVNKQVALNNAHLELATGKHADAGRELGAFTSTTISLEKQTSLIEQVTRTNSLLRNGITVMQESINTTIQQANDFIGQLTAELSDDLDTGLVTSLGNSMLGTLQTSLNVTFQGEHLFSGLNTDSKSLVDYNEADGLAAKTAVQNAFVTAFGFTANDPLAQTLSATDIENFIDGAFDNLFDDANWETLWSGSSERGRRSRISTIDFAENTTTAHNQAFRSVTSAAVLISEFASANLNTEARDQLVSSTISIMHLGIDRLSNEQATMGVMEERVASSDEHMEYQRNVLRLQVSDLTDVDPYEASLNLNQLSTSLEASYAVTARIRSLSLLNFI